MSNNRTKAPIESITRAEMIEALTAYRKAKIDEQDAIARMNAALSEVKKPFDEELATITTAMKTAFGTLEKWAKANKTDFAKIRTLTLPSGSVGFNFGKPAVKPISGTSFDPVLEFLLERKWLRKKYVRVVREVNKEALLADRTKLERRPKMMQKIGIRFTRSESFFADAKIETTDAVMKEAA